MRRDTLLKNELVVFLLAMICCLLWGSAFPCVKIGYKLFGIVKDDVYTQILYAGMRFFLAGFAGVVLVNLGGEGLVMTFRLNGEGFILLLYPQ